MKKYIFIGIAITSIFIIPKLGFAVTLYSQTSHTNESIYEGTPQSSFSAGGANTFESESIVQSGGQFNWGMQLGNNISGDVTTTTIYLRTRGGLGGGQVYGIRIECYTQNPYTSSTIWTNSFSAGCSSPTGTWTTDSSDEPKQEVSFSTNVTLASSNYYILGIGCISACPAGANPHLQTYGSIDNNYGGALSFAYKGLATSSISNTGFVDLYFVIEGEDTIIGTFADDIELIYPPNDSNNTQFKNWIVETDWAYLDGVFSVAVDYAFSSTTLETGTTGVYTDILELSASSTPFVVQNYRISIPRSEPYDKLPPGFCYRARGRLLRNGTTIDTSSENIFCIASEDRIAFLEPVFLSTSALDIVEEDCTDGGIATSTWSRAFCEAKKLVSWGLNTLFVPSNSSTAYLSNSALKFRFVFPFNIFFNFERLVQDNINSYSATGTLAWNLPSPTQGTWELSSSSINNIIGSSTNSYIRNVETNIAWLLAGLSILFFIII